MRTPLKCADISPVEERNLGSQPKPEHKGIWNGNCVWQPGTDGHPYLGVAQLEARVLWGHQAVSSSLTTQTIKEEKKMNEIQVFSNEKFGQVRTVMQDGEPWFVAADVCKALEIPNVGQALTRLEDDEKMNTIISNDGNRGNPTRTLVSEAGLYSLVISSRKPEAKAFKRWITHEVIPTIRKTGGYVHNSEVFIQNYLPFADDTTKQLFRLTLDVVDKQNKEIAANRKEIAEKSAIIEEMTPKASYYDLVINSPSLVPITEIAKDFGISAIALNRLLHTEGIQFLNNNMWVLYQKYADKGYVGTKTYAYPNKAGKMVNTRMQTFWTQKGRLFIYNLLKGKGILPIMERGVA